LEIGSFATGGDVVSCAVPSHFELFREHDSNGLKYRAGDATHIDGFILYKFEGRRIHRIRITRYNGTRHDFCEDARYALDPASYSAVQRRKLRRNLQHAQLQRPYPLPRLGSKIGEVVKPNNIEGAGMHTGPLLGMLIGIPVSLGLWALGGGIALLALH
jgi:hypothetical protein